MTHDGIERYSAASKWLHWLVALIVLASIPIGAAMTELEPGALQDRLYVLHESFGVTVLALMILRFANRLRGAPAPDPSLPREERIVATSVHHALYLLLLVTPIVGWLALSAYGLGPSFFWLGELPPLLVKDETLSKVLFGLHEAGGLLIGALALLHIAGALRHALRRDEIVRLMLPVSRRG